MMDEKKIRDEFEAIFPLSSVFWDEEFTAYRPKPDTVIGWLPIAVAEAQQANAQLHAWSMCAAHCEQQLAAKDAEIAGLRAAYDKHEDELATAGENKAKLLDEIAELRQQLEAAKRIYHAAHAKLAERENQEPVLWVEAEQSARGDTIKNVLRSLAYSTAIHVKEPAQRNGNPVWPLYAHPVPALAPGEVVEFIKRIAEQTPKKPDYWSSCAQCERNIDEAQELLAAKRTEEKGD